MLLPRWEIEPFMDLSQVSYWRSLAGKAGAVICLLALAALLDGLIAGFREPANLVRALPGATLEINGGLAGEAKGVQDLAYGSDSAELQVSFDAVHKGYFLGGDMWRGKLLVGPRIPPGKYRLVVGPRPALNAKGVPSFRILVYPDELSLRKSYKSYVRRHLGWSPFALAAFCLPGLLLAFGVVYFLSGKREAILARAGQAEVYRVLRREDGCEIRFGLGTEQGLGPGILVQIRNEQGQTVGTARVEESSPTDSVALVSGGREVKEGYLVLASGVQSSESWRTH